MRASANPLGRITFVPWLLYLSASCARAGDSQDFSAFPARGGQRPGGVAKRRLHRAGKPRFVVVLFTHDASDLHAALTKITTRASRIRLQKSQRGYPGRGSTDTFSFSQRLRILGRSTHRMAYSLDRHEERRHWKDRDGANGQLRANSTTNSTKFTSILKTSKPLLQPDRWKNLA